MLTAMLSSLYEYFHGLNEDKSRVLIETIGLEFYIKKGKIESLSLQVIPERYTAYSSEVFSTFKNEDGNIEVHLPEDSYKLFEDYYNGEPIKRDSYYDKYEATYKIYYNLLTAMNLLEYTIGSSNIKEKEDKDNE